MPYSTVAKILQSNCRQSAKKYVPVRLMWLNGVFADLANIDERHCLTTDCSGVNKNGLADIELKLMIQKNTFVILINNAMMSYKMLS